MKPLGPNTSQFLSKPFPLHWTEKSATKNFNQKLNLTENIEKCQLENLNKLEHSQWRNLAYCI